MPYLTIFLIVAFAFWPRNYPPFFLDIWHAQIFALFVAGTLLISKKLLERVHWSVIPPFMLASYSAYSFYFWPEIIMKGFGLSTIMAFGSLVIGSYVFMLMCVLPFILGGSKTTLKFTIALMAVVFIDSLIMIFNGLVMGPLHGFHVVGLLENNSMDACFVACLVPLFLGAKTRFSYACLIPIFMAIGLAQSVTGFLALATAVSIFYFMDRGFKDYIISFLSAIALMSATLAFVFYFWPWKFTAGDGRYHIWQLASDFWFKEANQWLGTGLGSFQLYGPGLLLQTVPLGTKIEFWIWMHSDWLQVLFELGWTGLVSVLVMTLCALWRARKSPPIFTSLVVFCMVALVQMPVRHTIFALLGAYLLKICFEQPKNPKGDLSTCVQYESDKPAES